MSEIVLFNDKRQHTYTDYNEIVQHSTPAVAEYFPLWTSGDEWERSLISRFLHREPGQFFHLIYSDAVHTDYTYMGAFSSIDDVPDCFKYLAVVKEHPFKHTHDSVLVCRTMLYGFTSNLTCGGKRV